ncbi:6313_t:CDS:2, partial [Dentiscutata erythropus]
DNQILPLSKDLTSQKKIEKLIREIVNRLDDVKKSIKKNLYLK